MEDSIQARKHATRLSKGIYDNIHNDTYLQMIARGQRNKRIPV